MKMSRPVEDQHQGEVATWGRSTADSGLVGN